MVREHRPAQRQARQTKGKRENRYVIKVMKIKINREGDGFPWFARTKGSTKPFNWSVIIYSIFILPCNECTGLRMHTGKLCYSK